MTNQNYAWDRYAPADTSSKSVSEFLTNLTAAGATAPADLVPLGNVIAGEVIASTVDNVPDVPSQVPRVEVGEGGVIQFRDDATEGREAVSEVTLDSFYVDLNAIADAVKTAQQNDGHTTDPDKRVFVGSEGNLLMGDEATSAERVAEVTGDTFYAPPGLQQEGEFVRANMPRNTMHVSDGTYEGWHFTITNEFGDAYGLFLYYHPSYGVYRVALISPRMEGGVVDVHGTHLWPDGTLCLTHANGSGYPSMAATYAKAALWTRGASCYRRGYGFQFNVGQD
jgi:hypothetical protein